MGDEVDGVARSLHADLRQALHEAVADRLSYVRSIHRKLFDYLIYYLTWLFRKRNSLLLLCFSPLDHQSDYDCEYVYAYWDFDSDFDYQCHLYHYHSSEITILLVLSLAKSGWK